MGQCVSASESVRSWTLKRHKQYFLEHNEGFAPVVKRSYVYEVSVNGPSGTGKLRVSSLQGNLVEEISIKNNGDGVLWISVEELSVTGSGFYKVSFFDISLVVFLEDESGKNAEPAFRNDAPKWLPDSIEFRQTIESMEFELQHFQKGSVWKNLHDSLIKVNEALMQLSQQLNNVTGLYIPSLSQRNPLIRLINADLVNRLQSFRKNHVDPLSKSLSSNVINPMYEYISYNSQNQKSFSRYQKNFNDLTKTFYVSPSLSYGPISQKKDFELARLDYYDFLYQSLFNGLPLRKLANSIYAFLTDRRINESEFNLSYIPSVNALRSSIKKSDSLLDLAALYSNFRKDISFKEDIVLVRYLRQNDNSKETSSSNSSNNASSSAPNHWHRQWITLNDHILQLYSTSKKLQNSNSSPFHQINLSFACIKQINNKTLEVITTGSPVGVSTSLPSAQTPTVTATTTAATRTPTNEDITSPARFLLQLQNEDEAKSWLKLLRQQAAQESNEISKSFSSDGSSNASKKTNNTLLETIQKQHESNRICCDCGNVESVEWISINILCVVCIKCSGVHRSMGSHISKMRSLTLDNFSSAEILQLLQSNVSNTNVNSIYESSSLGEDKVSANSNDADRSKYITNKYQFKKYVDDGNQSAKRSFKALIKAIHLNSIYLLQKCIAQSRLSLKEITEEEKHKNESEQTPSIFQYSLKHHEMINGKPIFYITEFLLINGIPIDKLPADTSNWAPSVINYWRSKLDIYETYKPVKLDKNKEERFLSSGTGSKAQLPSLSIPNDRSNKRWSLNPIPSSAQLKSPTNLLTMHKSLKLSKRGANNHKE